MAFASFAPLRHRNFALTTLSSFVSSIGTWMQSVALGVYLTLTTHNPEWLGLITLAGWLPAIVGSPVGGVMADRVHRQRWIQANNLVMAITASSLAALQLTGHLTPAIACLLALIEGFSSSASWAAWQSLLPDLVEKDEVLAAVSMSSAQFNLGRVIGPVLAGVALAVGSPGLCFALNAASFVFVIVVFAFVRTPHRDKPTHKVRFFAETAHGARAAWRSKGCRYPIIGVGLTAFIASPFIALIPAMAIEVLHAGKSGTSWLVTSQGVGAVTGAFTLPTVAKKTSRLTVLAGSFIAMAIGLVGYGLSPNLLCASGALFILGASYLGVLTGLNASVQLHAPKNERSRILALYTLSLSIFYPIGAVLQSAIAKAWTVRSITVSEGLVLAAVLAGLFLFHRTFWREIGVTPVEEPVLLAD